MVLTTDPPSSAEVKERAELHFYTTSGPSWPVRGWPLLVISQSFELTDTRHGGRNYLPLRPYYPVDISSWRNKCQSRKEIGAVTVSSNKFVTVSTCVNRTTFRTASAPRRRDWSGESMNEREGEWERYWKDGPFVKTDGTSTEASRCEPKAVEKWNTDNTSKIVRLHLGQVRCVCVCTRAFVRVWVWGASCKGECVLPLRNFYWSNRRKMC